MIAGLALAFGAASRDKFISFIRWADPFGRALSSEPASYGSFYNAVMADLMKFTGFVAVVMVFSLIVVSIRKGRAFLGFLLVAITALSLFLAHHDINATMPEEYYRKGPQVLDYMDKEDAPHRIYNLIFEKRKGALPLYFSDVHGIYLWEKEALKPNIGSIWGVQYADSESALRLSTQLNFVNHVISAPPGIKEKLLGIFNVKYVLAYRSQEEEVKRHDPYLELVQKFDKSGLLLYRNKRFLPRAYYVPTAKLVGTDEQALAAILEEDFNPAEEAVIKAGRDIQEVKPAGEHGERVRTDTRMSGVFPAAEPGLDILQYSDSLISIGANYSEGGYLVLSDAFYPGWTATMDNEPVELLRANYLFRAVKIPGGRHMVRFTYTPYAFKKGMTAGLPVAVLGIILVLAFYYSARRRAAYSTVQEEPDRIDGSD